MIKGLWNKIEIVCGCHEAVHERPVMTPKAGHRSMFYSCPKYYPDAREKGETACVNHVSTDDFQKILDKICEEAEDQMAFGQSASLTGLSFSIKTIDVKVIEHSQDKIVIMVVNHKALAL